MWNNDSIKAVFGDETESKVVYDTKRSFLAPDGVIVDEIYEFELAISPYGPVDFNTELWKDSLDKTNKFFTNSEKLLYNEEDVKSVKIVAVVLNVIRENKKRTSVDDIITVTPIRPTKYRASIEPLLYEGKLVTYTVRWFNTRNWRHLLLE